MASVATDPTPQQARRRRAAAYRCAPLDHGHRDPLDQFATPAGPSSYGLTRAELLRELRRCAANGWSPAELRARFTLEGATA